MEYIQKTSVESKDVTLLDILFLFRVQQWVKNIFVFAGVLVSTTQYNINTIFRAIIAFFLFCGVSSTIYIFNDLIDIEKDRLHPKKKNRPLAAGRIKKGTAIVVDVCLAIIVLGLGFYMNKILGIIYMTYMLLNLAYSLKLKEYVIIDIFIIAIGFMLRIMSGVVVCNGNVSMWFMSCMAFLMLYLGFNKRKKELGTLSENASQHRKNLSQYSVEFINEVTPMLTALVIITYIIYIMNDIANIYMLVTTPCLLYGIIRYQYLLTKDDFGERPEMVLLKDRPLIGSILIWGIAFLILRGPAF